MPASPATTANLAACVTRYKVGMELATTLSVGTYITSTFPTRL